MVTLYPSGMSIDDMSLPLIPQSPTLHSVVAQDPTVTLRYAPSCSSASHPLLLPGSQCWKNNTGSPAAGQAFLGEGMWADSCSAASKKAC
eukprot:CAMPEP_0173466024 /NCGR_PEP_ID=MMETSP1357-20121228/72582_1 /TAXON_ID=77926 /ORGANISM="Hemiselmis rufescens, Strain PCC563" /LENGTH=89 /DNA_ID=CAMNT_0014434039 /DNA_START=375 /DNA_END=644 /DNA_ORIENTATION=+